MMAGDESTIASSSENKTPTATTIESNINNNDNNNNNNNNRIDCIITEVGWQAADGQVVSQMPIETLHNRHNDNDNDVDVHDNDNDDIHDDEHQQHQQQQRYVNAGSRKSVDESMRTSDAIGSTAMDGGNDFGLFSQRKDIFDAGQKRFSNIETLPRFPVNDMADGRGGRGGRDALMTAEHKRYSNIETTTYETKKRIENGRTVLDVTTTNCEKLSEGEKPSGVDFKWQFPMKEETTTTGRGTSSAGPPPPPAPPPSSSSPSSSATATATTTTSFMNGNMMKDMIRDTTMKCPSNVKTTADGGAGGGGGGGADDDDARGQSTKCSKNSRLTTESTTTTTTSGYEEFRQRAKVAAAAAAEADAAANATTNVTANICHGGGLFKDFDELARQLNRELDACRQRQRQHERHHSASLYDLSRLQTESKTRFDAFKRQRHEHMKELEQEIERSLRCRQTGGAVIEIPIHVEEGGNGTMKAPPSSTATNGETSRMPAPPISTVRGSHFRRTESMFDVSPTTTTTTQCRPSDADDWTRYAQDLGSSENITRPFAREVEICYQRCRPTAPIRAPRLSSSVQDLNNQQQYSHHHHHHSQQQQQYPNCHSMLERDPNPFYISTTGRRGASPAPTYSPTVAGRRVLQAPREIQEQQLKYISSKEEELRHEYERLQRERQRLINEMNKETPQSAPPPPPTPPPTPTTPTTPTTYARAHRDGFRAATKLPTLTEDEVFRQQMAEEWLNKVAEREERRLQKIIKVSKMGVTGAAGGTMRPENGIDGTNATMLRPKADIGDEFLKRVQERRTKLAMPADSDWESGAESQTVAHAHGDDMTSPSLKVIEGNNRPADVRQLPKHLKEFAQFGVDQHATEEKFEEKEEHHHQQQQQQQRESTTTTTTTMTTKRSSILKTGRDKGDTTDSSAPIASPSARPLKGDAGRYQYQSKSNGYLSEPEPNYDSDYSTVKYRTLDRRRLQSTASLTAANDHQRRDETICAATPNPIKSGHNSYKNQPGRIEDYITGHSSVSERERKEHLEQAKLSPHYTEGNLSRALTKESGYASDSNLVFRRKELPLRNPLSPVEQKLAYKSVQAGGEPPLYGFRKPAPEKPKESPNRYIESDVNIHYKTPIRYEYKEPIPEDELAMRQAEQMQRLYQEERRRKYLQELQDMNARRHTDNFTASQKSPIPLNRYDDFPTDLAPKSPSVAFAMRTIARALYNFQGQSARELTFKKGDVIYIRRQIDRNWYEGEHNAMVGLLPANYVEIISKDGIRQANRKPAEGHARAKYNFQAQSGIELSLNKGELVTLTRRVDDNWFEGRIANRKGIFPVSYVEVLSDIGSSDYNATPKISLNAATAAATTAATPHMRPTLDALRTNINHEFNLITQNGHQPPNGILRETRGQHKTDILHVDTTTAPIAYRALYKYRPQNSDELELIEGDVVHVLEKCDDGWFVGTSQRSGCFGTFPGNYVERA